MCYFLITCRVCIVFKKKKQIFTLFDFRTNRETVTGTRRKKKKNYNYYICSTKKGGGDIYDLKIIIFALGFLARLKKKKKKKINIQSSLRFGYIKRTHKICARSASPEY